MGAPARLLVSILERDLGAGRSRSWNSFIEKRRGLLSTTRNRNTLLTMRELGAGEEG